MPFELDNAARLALKKQAHHLKPIVQSGAAGLTEPVLSEIDRALVDHELVKIKLAADDKATFKTEVDSVCEQLRAACVQQIGRTATIYRPNPDKPKAKPAVSGKARGQTTEKTSAGRSKRRPGKK